ncbi:hypothetical protein DKX38_000980 [Salix brachista]|uniref:Pentacotripeptide-repeat region of PRORP domain-containing protein n=1 Tax=Salix brachista TaxID=2182728 RepID=A0A5N5P4R8_9ROSI|nr:hypothetical protein DKX38_000980 [Salix brachista]
MLSLLSLKKTYSTNHHLFQISKRLSVAFSSTAASTQSIEVEKIARIINDHPFPYQPLHPTLTHHIPPTLLTTAFVENVLGRLFAAHSNGLKALEFFKYSLNNQAHFVPSPDSFEKTLHILARMRYFDKAWELMVEIGKTHPFLLTLKSMSIMLCRIAKFRSYEETLDAFEKMEKRVFVGRKFGVEEFNVLLRAFCTVRKLKEAKSVFVKMHERFPPNLKTMNILLLGFKESRDITAMELFYHEMVKRGFKPSCSSYGIRIDAYCKKGYFADALRIFEEMEKANCLPTLETVTTLIHGAGVARNAMKARELFDKIPKRNLQADTGAYNALISSLFKCRDLKSAIQLMDEMEKNNIHYDDMTYHTMFLGLMKSGSIEGVCELYHKMIDRNFVPKTRTVVMLMKFFCVNSQIDLGLSFWGYLVEKGYCPHHHALDLLVTGLCSRGRSHEALKCSKQSLERGIHVSEAVYRMLERFLLQSNMTDKLRELNQMIEKLQSVLPPSSGNYIHSPSSAMEEDVVD